MIADIKPNYKIKSKSSKVAPRKEVPSKYLISSIKISEKEIRNNDFYSFKNTKEALEFLDKIEENKPLDL